MHRFVPTLALVMITISCLVAPAPALSAQKYAAPVFAWGDSRPQVLDSLQRAGFLLLDEMLPDQWYRLFHPEGRAIQPVFHDSRLVAIELVQPTDPAFVDSLIALYGPPGVLARDTVEMPAERLRDWRQWGQGGATIMVWRDSASQLRLIAGQGGPMGHGMQIKGTGPGFEMARIEEESARTHDAGHWRTVWIRPHLRVDLWMPTITRIGGNAYRVWQRWMLAAPDSDGAHGRARLLEFNCATDQMRQIAAVGIDAQGGLGGQGTASSTPSAVWGPRGARPDLDEIADATCAIVGF